MLSNNMVYYVWKVNIPLALCRIWKAKFWMFLLWFTLPLNNRKEGTNTWWQYSNSQSEMVRNNCRINTNLWTILPFKVKYQKVRNNKVSFKLFILMLQLFLILFCKIINIHSKISMIKSRSTECFSVLI